MRIDFHRSRHALCDAGAQVTPCCIRYELDDGAVEREVCWWGDMALLPHVLDLLAKKTIRATIAFGDPMPATGDRQQLSQTLHREVLRLHQQLHSSGKTGLVDPAAVPQHSE